MDSGIISNVLLSLALAIIMYGLGLSLKVNDFRRIFQYPKAMFLALLLNSSYYLF